MPLEHRAAPNRAAVPSADQGLHHFSIEYLPPLVTLTIAACLAS